MTDQTTTFIVTEYNPVDAALAELRDKYEGVIFPVETKDGMKDAKEVRSKLTKLRTGLEKLRKEIKEPALRRTQAIDAEAKLIEKAIRAIEEPIDAQIKVEEQRIEAEKAAKAAREAEIKSKIDGIRNLPLALAGCTADDIAMERDALDAFEPVEEAFGEFTAECIEAKRECVLALCDLWTRVMAQEVAAANVEAERERLAEVERQAAAKLAAEREAFEAEKAAYEAEKRAFEERKAAEAAAPVAAPSGAETEPMGELSGKHPNGAPMYSETTFKENGDPIMLNEDGTRSIFCDIADGDDEVMPVADVTAEESAQVFSEKPDVIAQAEVIASSWKIRRLAMATADQFHALAGKVELCGFSEFASTIRAAGNQLHEGAYDAALTKADHEALIAADTLMLDATVEAIDAINEDKAIAA